MHVEARRNDDVTSFFGVHPPSFPTPFFRDEALRGVGGKAPIQADPASRTRSIEGCFLEQRFECPLRGPLCLGRPRQHDTAAVTEQ